jgi:hypothetical protein
MNDFALPPRPSRKVLVLSVLGLAVFLAVEALLLRHFIRVDTRPASWDQSTHLEIALDYREAIGAGRWGDAWFLAPKPGMPPFPPAYHLLLRGAFDSADPVHAALWLNWFYMAVLAVSLFGVAWRFLPDYRALGATIAFCASPGLQDLMTTQLMDLAVVAWVSAAYWALLSSEGFTGWAPALAFGVLHAVGMMHKWTFFSYLLPAYIIAGRALGDRNARLKVVAAAGLSLALSAPWYWSHMALLPSRLVQASADFAIPFWKAGAWAAYLQQACGALGPLLWALGFISLLTPQYARRRENGWVLGYWVVFSYVFWTIVPNRQIRFLLPGLAPLGVAMAATWPPGLTWTVTGFQLLAMLNFSFGAFGPYTLQMPFLPMTFFENKPPAAEDWKIGDILERIEAERDPTRPLTNVTLVANDAYFNAPTFHFVQRMKNLPHVRMRGVNKRLCELSEFLLLKQGRLGPESVIGGLAQAQKAVEDPEGWFSQAYERIATWPLPDGSAAVLYRQRRGRPIPDKHARVSYEVFATGEVTGAGLRIELADWAPALSSWKNVRVAFDRISVRGLVLRNASADLQNFSFVTLSQNEIADYDWDELRLMRVDRVTVHALEVDAADLKVFLQKRVPGLKVDALTLDGTIKVEGHWNGKPVTAEAGLDYDREGRRLKVRIVSASYLGAPVPAALFRPIKELNLSLDPNPETPFFIDLPGLTIKGGKLTVP